MTSFIFDTGALSLIYAEDQRLRPILERIQSGSDEGALTSVTLSEFYYKTCQTLGLDVATLRSHHLRERLRVIDAGIELSLAAGAEKCHNGNLSLADAFALALTRRKNGTLLTTDSELAKADAKVRHFEI